MSNPIPVPVLPYATPKDLKSFAFSEAQYNRLDQTAIVPCLNAASDFAKSYLSSQYNLPLISFGADLTMNVCFIAAFFLMIKVGFNPDISDDVLIKSRYDYSLKWFQDIANDLIHPPYIDTPVNAQNTFVMTQPSRGYNQVPCLTTNNINLFDTEE